jgi:hypothetical protein
VSLRHELRCMLLDSIYSFAVSKARGYLFLFTFWMLTALNVWAAAGGSITGTVTDTTGAIVPSAKLTLVNQAQKTTYRAATNSQGVFSFLNLPVGRYDLTVVAPGFSAKKVTSLLVDTDASLRADVALAVGGASDTVTVNSNTGAQVDTSSTHLGEVVTGAEMTALPLNGRSFTDLLSIQPGVAPASTLLPNAVIMAGVTGGISPSGDENPGNISINGQRESSNGFMVNGMDVQEHMNGGTSVVPDLDSIEQFRVLTNNFDPEYGNYNGGMVTVVTKSGGSQLHGSIFEFFRNTALDARGYFDPSRPAFKQNQFGGTIGGPVPHARLFFFGTIKGHARLRGFRRVRSQYQRWPSALEIFLTLRQVSSTTPKPISLLVSSAGPILRHFFHKNWAIRSAEAKRTTILVARRLVRILAYFLTRQSLKPPGRLPRRTCYSTSRHRT